MKLFKILSELRHAHKPRTLTYVIDGEKWADVLLTSVIRAQYIINEDIRPRLFALSSQQI